MSTYTYLNIHSEWSITEGISHCLHLPFFFQERKAATVSVEVRKSQHKYVIGPKGNTINEILADTGVFVEMPSSDSVSETITLRGPQEKLGLGEQRESAFDVVPRNRMTIKLLERHESKKCDLMSLSRQLKNHVPIKIGTQSYVLSLFQLWPRFTKRLIPWSVTTLVVPLGCTNISLEKKVLIFRNWPVIYPRWVQISFVQVRLPSWQM